MNHEAMIDELKRDEADKPHPYFDCGHPPVLTCHRCGKGILTIGIGRNLRDKPLSQEERYHLLNNDIDEVIVALDQHFPWWSKLDEVRQRVLVNMAFNMGVEKLSAFTHTLGFIQSGDYASAADEMLRSAWAKQVGVRADRLAAMMRTGTV